MDIHKVKFPTQWGLRLGNNYSYTWEVSTKLFGMNQVYLPLSLPSLIPQCLMSNSCLLSADVVDQNSGMWAALITAAILTAKHSLKLSCVLTALMDLILYKEDELMQTQRIPAAPTYKKLLLKSIRQVR